MGNKEMRKSHSQPSTLHKLACPTSTRISAHSCTMRLGVYSEAPSPPGLLYGSLLQNTPRQASKLWSIRGELADGNAGFHVQMRPIDWHDWGSSLIDNRGSPPFATAVHCRPTKKPPDIPDEFGGDASSIYITHA